MSLRMKDELSCGAQETESLWNFSFLEPRIWKVLGLSTFHLFISLGWCHFSYWRKVPSSRLCWPPGSPVIPVYQPTSQARGQPLFFPRFFPFPHPHSKIFPGKNYDWFSLSLCFQPEPITVAGFYDYRLPFTRSQMELFGGVYPRSKELLFWRVKTTNVHEKRTTGKKITNIRRDTKTAKIKNLIARIKYSINFGNFISWKQVLGMVSGYLSNKLEV